MHKFSSDITLLRKYINGELSSRQMHEIERASHEDEMLMDILMGLEEERNLKSNPPTLDINKYIKQHHIPVNKIHKPWFLKRPLQIVASIVVLLTVAAMLYWINQPISTPQDLAVTKNKNDKHKVQSENEAIETVTDRDTTKQQQKESNAKRLPSATEHLYATNTTRPTLDRPLTAHEKQLLAYTPEQKNIEINQDLLGALNVSTPKHDSDVIVINTEADDGRSNLIASNARKSLQAKAASIGINSNPNIRSRLISMGLDPQASYILGQVIDQQSRTPLIGVEVKDLQSNKIVLTDEEGRFAFAANTKKNLEIKTFGYKPKEIAAESGEQTIILIPEESIISEITVTPSGQNTKSSPSQGWLKYKKQMHDEITKLTDLEYNFNISMELDQKGKPTRISILTSSNSNLNTKIVQLIEKSAVWEKGSDWKNINFELKSP